MEHRARRGSRLGRVDRRFRREDELTLGASAVRRDAPFAQRVGFRVPRCDGSRLRAFGKHRTARVERRSGKRRTRRRDARASRIEPLRLKTGASRRSPRDARRVAPPRLCPSRKAFNVRSCDVPAEPPIGVGSDDVSDVTDVTDVTSRTRISSTTRRRRGAARVVSKARLPSRRARRVGRRERADDPDGRDRVDTCRALRFSRSGRADQRSPPERSRNEPPGDGDRKIGDSNEKIRRRGPADADEVRGAASDVVSAGSPRDWTTRTGTAGSCRR